MTCARMQGLLPLVPGDELPLAVDAAARTHLRRCHACQRELASYVAAGTALRRGTSGPVLGEGFFSSLRAATVAAAASLPPPRSSRRLARVARRAALAAALVAVGVGLAWRALVDRDAPGAALLRQPGLAQRDARPAGTSEMIVPVSFSPRTQGLRGLQRLGLDPRWNPDNPRVDPPR